MNDSKVLAFAFGAVSMTLFHYFYWGWLTDGLINGTSVGPYAIMLIPVILTFVYCVFEKFVLYSFICPDGKFLDTIPSIVVWIVECVIGTFYSAQTVSDHWSDPECGPGLIIAWSLMSGFEMIIAIVYFHLILYVNNKEMKRVLLVMLVLFLLQVAISAFMDWY